MKKFTVILLIMMFAVAFGQNSFPISGMPNTVKTPEDLVKWLSKEFKYTFEFPDEWQSPHETIEKKTGDCEDFAFLVSDFLKEKGFNDNRIIVVKFKGLSIRHAICTWKGKDGNYNFISNKRLYKTRQKTMESMIAKYYPDYESINPLRNLRKGRF